MSEARIVETCNEAPLTVVLRFTAGPWFETENDEYGRLIPAPVRAESASCIGVENNTARAWDWGQTCDLDGDTPAFNVAALTHLWPEAAQLGRYGWSIATPNGVELDDDGYGVTRGHCATLAEAQAMADAALLRYCRTRAT
jgi:hypothetical protein